MTAAPPDPAAVQATFCATLVDEWVRAGLTDAVVCPGSRSTPLALALAGHAGVRLHVHHDERSAGFLALGIGLATGRPAAVLTTSGTAAAELHPAVVEADLAAVPLLACTADRPPELRDVGAPQTIDQVHLYGRAARWFGDPGVPDAGGADRWRPLAARAYAAAVGGGTGGPPGPVHLNLPFREPLVGTPGPLPPARAAGPWVRAAGPGPGGAPPDLPAVAGRRGLIVAGAVPVDGDRVHAVAAALGWPVVAEPRSPAWRPAPTTVSPPRRRAALARRVLRTATRRDRPARRPGLVPGGQRVAGRRRRRRRSWPGRRGWSDPAGTRGVRWSRTRAPRSTRCRRADAAPPDGWLARWQAVADSGRRGARRHLRRGQRARRRPGGRGRAARRGPARGVVVDADPGRRVVRDAPRRT